MLHRSKITTEKPVAAAQATPPAAAKSVRNYAVATDLGSLRDLHALPNDALVTRREAAAFYRLKHVNSFSNWVATGRAPPPVYLGFGPRSEPRWVMGTLRRHAALLGAGRRRYEPTPAEASEIGQAGETQPR